MHSNRRAILGLLLVLIGVLLLLDNLGVIPGLPQYLFTWPSFFFLIAVVNFVSGNRGGALIFASIGAFLVLERNVDIDFQVYWPLILVIIGLAILLRRRSHTANAEIGDRYFDDINIFGGGSKRFTSQSLDGGKITNIFGGSEIDLRDALPREGATIHVFTMFGGSNILVPTDWNVELDTTSIFGAFEDKRDKAVSNHTYTLRVKGVTIFGGGEIRSSK